MRTLVTGANGFAGSHLLDVLGHGPELIAWYRPGTALPPGTRIQWQSVELTDAAAVARALREAEPDRIYHLAGAPSVESSWRNAVPHLQTNALGTHHLLEGVRLSGRATRVLVISSAQVYQASDDPIGEDTPLVPTSPYGFTKLGQDQLAARAHRDDGIDALVARPFNHIGPRQTPEFAVSSFARQIARIEAGLAPPELRVGNLEARRDFTDVRDVAAAYVALMNRGRSGGVYNVCSGRAFRMRDLLESLRSLASVEVHIETDPAKLRPSDMPVLQGDASRLARDLGWAPVIPIEQTLEDTLDWWREDVRSTA
ncbi:MAG: GDP-mannose 4,6-dehydratase [Vicinamibacterales bacterium]